MNKRWSDRSLDRTTTHRREALVEPVALADRGSCSNWRSSSGSKGKQRRATVGPACWRRHDSSCHDDRRNPDESVEGLPSVSRSRLCSSLLRTRLHFSTAPQAAARSRVHPRPNSREALCPKRRPNFKDFFVGWVQRSADPPCPNVCHVNELAGRREYA